MWSPAGPRRVPVAPGESGLTFITYCRASSACTAVPCGFGEALVPSHCKNGCYRAQRGVRRPPALTGFRRTARARFEFAPAHKCLYQQMLLIAFLFSDHPSCSCVTKSAPRWLRVFPIRTLQMCRGRTCSKRSREGKRLHPPSRARRPLGPSFSSLAGGGALSL